MSHSHKKLPNYIKVIEKTVVLESSIHRYGLFASENITKDEILGTLTGQLVAREEYEKILMSAFFPKECFIEKVAYSDKLIMMMPIRTSYGFINHGEDMLMLERGEGQMHLSFSVIAKRNIEKGEEITMKYELDKHIDILGGFTNQGEKNVKK